MLLFQTAIAYDEVGDCESAVLYYEDYRDRLRQWQRGEVDWRLGNCSFQLARQRRAEEDDEEALRHLETLLRIGEPRNLLAMGYYEKGEILGFRGECEAAVEAFRALPERNRFIRGLVSWIGFRQVAVSYRRSRRLEGVTKYPFRKMLRFAIDGITSFSFLPLRLATWAGFAVSVCAFLYIAVVIVLKAIGVSWSGYTSLMASILFLGGVQLLMIGILGEYLARIFDEVKRRPLYLVGESTDGESAVVPPSRHAH